MSKVYAMALNFSAAVEDGCFYLAFRETAKRLQEMVEEGSVDNRSE
jgi:hypothetical protein